MCLEITMNVQRQDSLPNHIQSVDRPIFDKWKQKKFITINALFKELKSVHCLLTYFFHHV